MPPTPPLHNPAQPPPYSVNDATPSRCSLPPQCAMPCLSRSPPPRSRLASDSTAPSTLHPSISEAPPPRRRSSPQPTPTPVILSPRRVYPACGDAPPPPLTPQRATQPTIPARFPYAPRCRPDPRSCSLSRPSLPTCAQISVHHPRRPLLSCTRSSHAPTCGEPNLLSSSGITIGGLVLQPYLWGFIVSRLEGPLQPPAPIVTAAGLLPPGSPPT